MSSSEPWITLGRTLEGCRRVCHNPESVVSVAVADGRRAGFTILQPRGVIGSPYLATIAVAPDYRGRGVGTRLIQQVEDTCRRGARHLFLCVSSFNPRAKALYERLGFRQVGELPDYLIDGASEFLMHKRLR